MEAAKGADGLLNSGPWVDKGPELHVEDSRVTRINGKNPGVEAWSDEVSQLREERQGLRCR